MWTDLLWRLRAIFRRDAVERELDDELRFHLDQQAAKRRSLGAAEGQSRRLAHLDLGGIEQVKEEARDARGVSTFENLARDVRYAARVLRKSPAFTTVALLSLALGIGANTSIFQLLDAIRLRTLPVRNPEELARVYVADMSKARGSVSFGGAVTYPIWQQIHDRQQAFSGVAAWSSSALNLSPSGEVRMAPSLWVSGEFFQELGVRPALGRLFTADDDRRGCGTPGAVISYAFWQREFSGEASAIGRRLSLNGHSVEVIGVTQAGFFGPEVGRAFQIALPICSVADVWFNALDAGTFWWLNVMGRLKPGWSTGRAAAHMSALSPGIFQESLPARYPPVSVKDYLAMKITAEPAASGTSHLRARYSDPLWLLLALAGLVLLIACANLANLMLARASARSREIAVRLAIGASRSRLVRQLMTESLLIAVSGAALGLLLANWLSRALMSLLGANSGAYLDLQADWRVLAFTGALSIAACCLFGLVPAVRGAASGPGAALKAFGRGLTEAQSRFGLRRVLVVSQVALSLVLLVGSLLFVRSLRNLMRADTGFRTANVMIVDLRFARANPRLVNIPLFQKNLLERVQAIPGVISVADTTVVPLSGSSTGNRIWLDGADSRNAAGSNWSRVTPGYFRTLDVPLLAGRDFDARDELSAPKVAIVNQAFVERFLTGVAPLGTRFHVEATPSTPEMVCEIVGVVRNTKYRDLRDDFRPLFYLPVSQDPVPNFNDQLLIHAGVPIAALLPGLRNAIALADPGARFDYGAYQEIIDESLLPERLMATLSLAFGMLAGLLAAIGLYGVISYMVARRRNEIGVRMALGAGGREIVALVLSESGKVLAAGLILGVGLSLALAGMARKLVFGLEPRDPLTIAAAAVAMSVVALAASYLPARGAARLDPLNALREE